MSAASQQPLRGLRPENAHYEGAAAGLQDVWVAVRASLRSVLEHVTLADIAEDGLPPEVAAYEADPDSWAPRWPQRPPGARGPRVPPA